MRSHIPTNRKKGGLMNDVLAGVFAMLFVSLMMLISTAVLAAAIVIVLRFMGVPI